jgi:hypothetical protein
MTHAGSIIAAWLIVGTVLALYALRLVLRGRALSRAVPPERRRWMQSPDDEPGTPR